MATTAGEHIGIVPEVENLVVFPSPAPMFIAVEPVTQH
jgi:hypothetical protein